jgi:hypothetical protein
MIAFAIGVLEDFDCHWSRKTALVHLLAVNNKRGRPVPPEVLRQAVVDVDGGG